MTNSKKYILGAFISIFSIIFILCNCCTASYCVIQSHSNPGIQNINITSIGNIDTTTIVKIYLNNGDIIKGKYLGLSTIPNDIYKSKYIQYYELYNSRFQLPALNEKLIIKSTRNKFPLIGEFQGLDLYSLSLDSLNYLDEPNNLLKKLNPIYAERKVLAYKNILCLKDESEIIIDTDFEKLLSTFPFPTKSNIVVNDSGKVYNINGNMVDTIRTYPKSKVTKRGLVFCGILDIFGTILASKSKSDDGIKMGNIFSPFSD